MMTLIFSALLSICNRIIQFYKEDPNVRYINTQRKDIIKDDRNLLIGGAAIIHVLFLRKLSSGVLNK